MGVDYYTCDGCEEAINENYFYRFGNVCDYGKEHIDKIIEQLGNTVVYCEHAFCGDCCPTVFLSILDESEKKKDTITEALTKPWHFCNICKREKEINDKINNPLTTREELIEIIKQLHV